MKWIISSLLKTFKLYGLALVPLFLIYTLLDQELTALIQNQLASSEGTPKTVWIFVIALMLFHMVFPLIAQTFLFASILNVSWTSLIRNKFSWALKESLRSWGSVLLWSLVLVIPGFFRYCQLVFVNFVVMMNPDYDSGKIDALKESQRVFSKKWKSSLGFLVLFGALIPVALLPFENLSQLLDNPIAASGLAFLQLILFLLSTLVFSLLFQNQQRGKNESVL